MKVLITGAAGFLGFHLAHHFLRQGKTVIGIDNLQTGQEQNVADLSNFDNFQFYNLDVIQLDQEYLFQNKELSHGLSGVTRIYHMACPASPPLYQKDPLHTLDTCYIGSRNLYVLASRLNARILVASTSEIYGDPEVHPQHEGYRGNVNTVGPRSCYDEGKRAMETLGYIFSGRGVEVRIARIFNTYGPRMSPTDGRVLTNFISQAIRGEPLTVYGNGSQTRSFCFYEDLVRGLILLMESSVVVPVNLGSQFEFTIRELAEIVIQQINPKLCITYLELPIDDPKQRRPDSTLARSQLGWEPKVSLKAGVSAMISYFLTRREEPVPQHKENIQSNSDISHLSTI